MTDEDTKAFLTLHGRGEEYKELKPGDVTYYDGTLQGVINAFRELPDADVIFFGIDMTRNGEVFDKRRNK